jgi:hypothetical protein
VAKVARAGKCMAKVSRAIRTPPSIFTRLHGLVVVTGTMAGVIGAKSKLIYRPQ